MGLGLWRFPSSLMLFVDKFRQKRVLDITQLISFVERGSRIIYNQIKAERRHQPSHARNEWEKNSLSSPNDT